MTLLYRTHQGHGGRVTAYALAGSGPRKAFFFHGHPGSLQQALFLEPHCKAAGVELLAFDRPGYGRSSPTPAGRAPLDLSRLLASLATEQGWTSFHLLAVSGGAPYALKAASLLGRRVRSVHLVCGLGPLHERELGRLFPWKLRLALRGESLLPAPLLGGLVRAGLPTLMKGLGPGIRPAFLSPDDFALLRSPEVRSRLRLSLRSAFRQGAAGAQRDARAFLGPWELDWSAIRCPVRLWHGLDDRMVPWRFSELLAKRLPKGRFLPCENEGHYTLPIRRTREILQELRDL